MTAYYNEIDPKAAAWLRELIKQGHIAPGVVDERSIEDVTPNELAGFTQCHFFAGVGVWSYALRKAGWPDDRPVWTGSCPCQPFSAAGNGKGFADERHLWPAWFHLIGECRPSVVFGEQVASQDGLAWLDVVQADLEAAGYACGALDTCAAGFGAPHIRQRLYFVADASRERCDREQVQLFAGGQNKARFETTGNLGACKLGDTISTRLEGHAGDGDGTTGRTEQARPVAPASEPCRPGPTNGLWRDSDWLFCRDGKWRPVEPGTFPLAHGAAARVGRLRGYGNAINAQQAQGFIEAYLES